MRDPDGRRIYVKDFYDRFYAPLSKTGALRAPDVKAHDPVFYQSLSSWISQRAKRDPSFTLRLSDLMITQARWSEPAPDGASARREARARARRALAQATKLIAGH